MNKKLSLLFLSACCAGISGRTILTEFPEASISNGIVQAQFYLPDAQKGYYRGTRFDWGGAMSALNFDGHSYCSQWFEKYEPTMHDAIMGPVESFAPIGYEDARPGDTFVQIGVGTLVKPKEDFYTFSKYYTISNHGEWKTKKKTSSITFTHILRDSICSYEYEKDISLLKGKPVMVLTHLLKNTGTKIIRTNVYDHNLLVLDQQPTGPDFKVKFPFAISYNENEMIGLGKDSVATVHGSEIFFNRVPAKGKKDHVYSALNGYTQSEKDYDIKIENHKTGAAVRINSNRPMMHLAFWASSNIFSPEPYIDIQVKPGESFEWKISYEFYDCKTQQ